jgi:hypothetical protein
MYIWIYMIQDYLCLCPAEFSYIVLYIWNSESHVHLDWCAPVKISNSTEYSVLQVLQFQEVSACRILPGGAGLSHN